MTVRQRFYGIVALAAGMGAAIVVDVWTALERIHQADEGERSLTAALGLHQDADMMHDALRADAYAAVLGTPGASVDMREHQVSLLANFSALDALVLPADVVGCLLAVRGDLLAWAGEADSLALLAATDSLSARARLPAFTEEFREIAVRMAATTATLASSQSAAAQASEDQRNTIRWALAWHMVVAVSTVCVAMAVAGGQSLSALAGVRGVAARLSAGDLSARNDRVSADEIGELALTFNALGDNLQRMASLQQADADRMRFASQLAEALEMAETEKDVIGVVQLALGDGPEDRTAALMLADSSRAKLRTVTRQNGGCDVESPWACVAMRRATPMTFASSERLGACPRLRVGDPCSAVCLPVNFTGRAIGVIRTTAPVGAEDPDSLARFATLANQAGARIGAIRAMDRARLQASTDALTGLVNRRTLESRVHQLEGPYAVIMADLDHFKRLNDTFGHQAGDHALRLFGQTVRGQQRSDDIACRYGGEEFVVVLPGITGNDALLAAARIRTALAGSFTGGAPPFTVSCGIADSTMQEGFEEILRAADSALYTAKARGRDQAVLSGAA